MSLPPIYFYIPQRYFPETVPENADENWPGFGVGMYAWTLQTYLRLHAEGFPCELATQFPLEGIVFVHHNAFRAHKHLIKPGRKLLLICLQAEGQPYPYAQLHIVQNPTGAIAAKNRYYIPHWTQPGLIPRHPQRGDRFENITYFGHVNNLAPELLDPSFAKQLEAMGLCWCPAINRNHWNDASQIDGRWNDYSEMDAIVAVRSFNCNHLYPDKPATKLFNAWLAGVPAVLGAESAYQIEGEKGKNYWEVNSLAELVSALERLKRDRVLRQTLVQNGHNRANFTRPSQITTKWRNFLENIAIPAYFNWCKTPHWLQQIELEKSHLTFLLERVQSKIQEF
jgi:hypothetical protein